MYGSVQSLVDWQGYSQICSPAMTAAQTSGQPQSADDAHTLSSLGAVLGEQPPLELELLLLELELLLELLLLELELPLELLLLDELELLEPPPVPPPPLLLLPPPSSAARSSAEA